uniref:Uncharacterized protein n=1 Tax=Cucumis sativus TaxID=3659 RepID=A0A0A0L774_CUCSA
MALLLGNRRNSSSSSSALPLAHPFFRKKELELHSPFSVSSKDFEGSPIDHEMFTHEDIKGTDFQALVTFPFNNRLQWTFV